MYMAHLYMAISPYNGIEVIPKIPLPQEQWEHDLFLMCEFIYLGFKKKELEMINQCRLYHQVVTLTDIATADGKAIEEAYTGSTRNADRVSKLQWPTQNCPSTKVWKQWGGGRGHSNFYYIKEN